MKKINLFLLIVLLASLFLYAGSSEAAIRSDAGGGEAKGTYRGNEMVFDLDINQSYEGTRIDFSYGAEEEVAVKYSYTWLDGDNRLFAEMVGSQEPSQVILEWDHPDCVLNIQSISDCYVGEARVLLWNYLVTVDYGIEEEEE